MDCSPPFFELQKADITSDISVVVTPLHQEYVVVTPLHGASFPFISLPFTSLHFTSFTSLHLTTFHFSSVHLWLLQPSLTSLTSLHCTSVLHFNSLHFSTCCYGCCSLMLLLCCFSDVAASWTPSLSLLLLHSRSLHFPTYWPFIREWVLLEAVLLSHSQLTIVDSALACMIWLSGWSAASIHP